MGIDLGVVQDCCNFSNPQSVQICLITLGMHVIEMVNFRGVRMVVGDAKYKLHCFFSFSATDIKHSFIHMSGLM